MYLNICKFLIVLPILVVCTFSQAGETTFGGSSLDSMRRTSTVAEYTGVIGPTGNLLDMSGHGFDMTPTGSPTTSFSDLQDKSGNRISSISLNGTTQYYSVGHNPAMDVFDTNFTLTLYIKPNGSDNTIFSHGLYNSDGIYVRTTSAGGVYTYLNKAGAGIAVQTEVKLTQGQWYVVQIVRYNDTVTEWINGVQFHVTGASVNAATYGIDGVRSMYIGAYSGGILPWAGQVAYVRLDSEALKVEELLSDVERIHGIYNNNNNVRWKFARTTSGEKSYSTGGVTTVSVNAPKVSNGGINISPTTTNIIAQSDSFDSGTWSKFYASSPNPNTYPGPDGEMTADILHEDGTAGQQHAFYQLLSGATARTLSFSIDVKKIPGGPRDWIFIDFSAGPLSGAYFNLTNGTIGSTSATVTSKISSVGDGWWRISISGLSAAAGAQYVEIMPATGDGGKTYNGLNVDVFLLARSQVEVGTPATTYCGPTVATPVSCNGDSLILPITAPVLASAGDSIARGLNPYIDALYGNVRNSAIGGYKTADVIGIIQTNIINSRAKHVFIHVGINDIVGDISAATIESNIESFVSSLESANVSVTIDNIGTASVAQYTAPRLATASAVNLWLQTTFAAAHPKARVLDYLGWATGGTNDPTAPLFIYFDPGDPVHPNAVGYASWSSYVFSQIQFSRTTSLLPISFGPTAPSSQFLTIEIDARCEFISSADIGQDRALFEISGFSGSASSTRNRVQIYIDSTGRVYGKLIDDSGASHYGYSAANPVYFTNFNSFKLRIDFSDLSNMEVLINGSTVGITYIGNVGASSLLLDNTKQRIGQDYNGDVSAPCTISKYRIEPFYF